MVAALPPLAPFYLIILYTSCVLFRTRLPTTTTLLLLLLQPPLLATLILLILLAMEGDIGTLLGWRNGHDWV